MCCSRNCTEYDPLNCTGTVPTTLSTIKPRRSRRPPMSATRKRFDDDPYLGHCTAIVVAASAEGIELDETVCYARSGGQAGDTATLALADGRSVVIADTVYADDRSRILHVPAPDAPLPRV